MGLFAKDYKCPKCGKTSRIFKWAEAKCPYCTVLVVPNYDIIGPTGDLTATQLGLLEAARAYPGAHIGESEVHPLLMAMAARHAKYQADRRQMGHQLFSERVAELQKSMGHLAFSEIAAVSWREQVNASKRELGDEMMKCWRNSAPHWSVASKKHKYVGGDMALGTDDGWYSCMLVAD